MAPTLLQLSTLLLLLLQSAEGGGYLEKLAAASREALSWGWDDYVRWGVQPEKRTDYLSHSIVFSQDDIDSARGYNVRRRSVCVGEGGVFLFYLLPHSSSSITLLITRRDT